MYKSLLLICLAFVACSKSIALKSQILLHYKSDTHLIEYLGEFPDGHKFILEPTINANPKNQIIKEVLFDGIQFQEKALNSPLLSREMFFEACGENIITGIRSKSTLIFFDFRWDFLQKIKIDSLKIKELACSQSGNEIYVLNENKVIHHLQLAPNLDLIKIEELPFPEPQLKTLPIQIQLYAKDFPGLMMDLEKDLYLYMKERSRWEKIELQDTIGHQLAYDPKGNTVAALSWWHRLEIFDLNERKRIFQNKITKTQYGYTPLSFNPEHGFLSLYNGNIRFYKNPFIEKTLLKIKGPENKNPLPFSVPTLINQIQDLVFLSNSKQLLAISKHEISTIQIKN